MLTQRLPRNSAAPALILWGDQFDAVATTIFATEFRKAGIRVELVGLVGTYAAGLHGLLLGSDISLGDALLLAGQARCVIIPCTLATMRRIDNDPRVYQLVAEASHNQAGVIVWQPEVVSDSRLQQLAIPEERLFSYATATELPTFAREIALQFARQPCV